MEQFKEFHKELERLKSSGFSTGEIKRVCNKFTVSKFMRLQTH